MSSIPIKIMLHGLIALVPNSGSNGANHMTALLLDARTAPPIEGCLSTHSPRLAFMVHDDGGSECVAAHCKLTGRDCVCTDSLAEMEITLDILPTPNPTGQDLTVGIPHSLPETRAEAGIFSYVSNLSRPPFGLKLDPDYFTSSPPSNLLARMDFDFDNVTACALFKRESAGIFNIHEASFRRLHQEGAEGDTGQAIPQMVMARLDVPDGGVQKVTLKLSSRDHTVVHSWELMPDNDGYMVELSNGVIPLKPDAPCDDGIGRHFAFFYDFAKDAVPSANRLVPHMMPTRWISAKNINPEECKMPTFAPMDRPMCPMASFDHP